MGYLWKRCWNGHELTHPTLADKLVGFVVCPVCAAEEPVDVYERREAVEELLAKIERLSGEVLNK